MAVEAGSGDPPDLVHQHETRCRILGVDRDGWTHVHDPRRDRIVVVSTVGIDQQVDLGGLDQDLEDWMQFVAAKRGWWKEQWDGYRIADAVFGGESA
jgi:hypothetical protein